MAIFHEYADYSTWRLAPPNRLLEQLVRYAMESWRASGGEPDIALDLPSWLVQAGFRIRSATPGSSAPAPSTTPGTGRPASSTPIRSMGYGSVADTPAKPVPTSDRFPDVTLYTAGVCPFCPISRRRLAELQRQGGFEVREIDVTFRPEVVRAKGLRSVPVVEAGGQLLVAMRRRRRSLSLWRGLATAGD